MGLQARAFAEAGLQLAESPGERAGGEHRDVDLAGTHRGDPRTVDPQHLNRGVTRDGDQSGCRHLSASAARSVHTCTLRPMSTSRHDHPRAQRNVLPAVAGTAGDGPSIGEPSAGVRAVLNLYQGTSQ
jgi:hypothetical protein